MHKVHPLGLLSTQHLFFFQENLPLLLSSQDDNKFKETIKGFHSGNACFIILPKLLGDIEVVQRITYVDYLTQALESIKSVVLLHPLALQAHVHIYI